VDVLQADVGKAAFEANLTEVADVAAGVRHLERKLEKLMKPERVSTPLIAKPGVSHIVREPLGVVLVISPWNYPSSLAVARGVP
jgi:acyl-CoA reductase-like NAD-dependent aldehyde dehydrogenase